MPSLMTTPGPLHHFVQFTSQGDQSYYYLGTAVIAPDVDGEQFKIPVLNDLGGRSVPFQLIQDGETDTVLTTLNRFDINVYRRIRALPSGVVGAPQPPAGLGQESGYARGTLAIGASDFQLVIVNGYAGTPAGGPGGAGALLNNARGWYSANLRRWKESTAGTRVLEVALSIECQNVFNPSTLGFKLYTESGIPNLLPLVT